MSHDQQSYRRAANAVLIGLAIQVLLTILTALTGLYADSTAINTIAWYFLGGVPIWVILWIVYNQHRLERVEALETEQLAAQDAQAAALFDEAGQQLQIAQKRLDNLYKYGLNIVSLLVSFYLIAVGFGMLRSAVVEYRAAYQIEDPSFFADIAGLIASDSGFSGYSSAGMVAIVALVIGFLAFIVSRYVAGMTKVQEWKLLRGGAGYLMGNVVATFLLIVAAALIAWDLNNFFPLLSVIAPVMMILLGFEMLLGFTFGFYQPRRPGQMPRPAFDSRVLGWLTRPESLAKIIREAIDYQFGIEVSDSWFYRQLSQAIPKLVIVGLLILFGLTSVVIVAPHQRAIVTRLGALTDHSEVGPGLHWKLPWPLGKAYKYDASRIQEINVGSSANNFQRDVAILWTTQHSESETYMVTAPSRYASEDNEEIGAAAGELAGALGVIKYRIADDGLRQYSKLALDDPGHPADLLEALSERRFNTYFATHDIDALLTTARITAGAEMRVDIQADADDIGLGIEVVYVGVEAVHPPMEGDVAKKFHEQIDARQEKKTKIQEAHRKAVAQLAEIAGTQDKALTIDDAIQEVVTLQQSLESMRLSDDYNEAKAGEIAEQVTQKKIDIEKLLDDAGGEATVLIHQARAYRWEHALNERARAMRTASRFFAYQQGPKYYMAREYLRTLSDGLADRRKFILVGDQPVPPIIRFNAETTTSNLDVLNIE